MNLSNILTELEELGNSNDSIESERSKKYLNITRDTGEFLSVLVKSTKSQNILEIGTSNGYSTIWLASSLPENGLVTTIECSLQKFNEAQVNFEKAKLTNKINQIHDEAKSYLAQLNSKFDIIFLDADRSLYMSMVVEIEKLLKPGGLIVTDNAISHEHELIEFMEYFKRKSEYSCCLVSVGKGEFLAYKSA
jgi:predicted O-methyltransferase YrrM